MLNHREERTAMMRFFVQVLQIQKNQMGSGDMSAMAVAWIVALGHLEGRLFNASSISSYLGMPRTTVMRKLRGLVEAGVIEQRGHEYYLAAKYEFMPDAQYAAVSMAIHQLSKQVPLPKMDTLKMDTPKMDTPKMDTVQSGHKEAEQQ